MRRFFHLLSAVFAMSLLSEPAVGFDVNYDEAKIPPYALPDPLQAVDGAEIRTADAWTARRRPELLALFADQVYGRTPPDALSVRYEVRANEVILAGQGRRKRVAAICQRNGRSHEFEICVYLPNNAPRPVPVFVGTMLFDKSHAAPVPGKPLEVGAPQSLGIDPADLPGERLLPTILARGYAVATLNVEEIAPDDAKRYRDGVIGLAAGESPRADDEWGAIGAWAWSLSRALDYFETDKDFDAGHVAAIGHSRHGKTALWAGAQDPRFALVISNDSGCVGAALSKRKFGETVKAINDRFPHWFAVNFRRYNGREQDLPVDQHELLALVAPRLLYVASAEDDRWADPRGEFLSALGADPVFRLLGQPGLGVKEMPAVNMPVGHSLGYHIRSGKHALTDYDWMQYLRFADRHWR